MKLITLTSVMLLMGGLAKAENTPELTAQQHYENEMSLEMCRALDHRFDAASHECIYCAHGLHYDAELSQCTGTPDVIGKCFGEDHYHADTKECMYCSKGYVFHEDIRECMPVLEENKEQKNKGE